MEGCRDRLVAALSKHDQATARQLSSVLDALLHLDGEVRRHAEPRFLVEATLARLAVELGPTVPEPAREAVGRAQDVREVREVREPALEPVMPVRPVGETASELAGEIAGWSEVLEKLNRTVRAAYLDAQPEVDGSTLVLWFRYGFHHKKAQEQSAQLMPHVRAWLGDGVKVDYRLREHEAAKPAAAPASPEDDPFVG